MFRILTFVAVMLAFTNSQGICSDTVTLVENGRPISIIVTAENPAAAAKQGAKDLQMWLWKMTGALVPIKTEGGMSKKVKEGLLLIGETKQTRSLGINPDEFDLEEIVVRTFPGVLVIIGDDKRPDGYDLKGTVFAVDAFAEEILGIRLLWPGELGEIIPRRSTIELNDVNIREKPILVDRDMVNLGYNQVTHSKLDALGWDKDKYRSFQEISRLWFRFHRIGGSYNGSFGHAFGNYWERFHEEHPEWFALQPDGTRDNSQPEHALYPSHRLCISNPELIAQVASDCIRTLKNNPLLDTVSISPNDGGKQTFCLCKRCESWDAPGGETIYMKSRNSPIPHVSLTDRFVRFYSEVAKIVAKQYPNRYLGAYAYHHYTLAPIHAELHPGIVIGFVPEMKTYLNEAEREEMRSNWLKWSKTAQKLFVRPNSLMALHALPTVYIRRLANDMRFYADNKMLFARYDCNFHHWATNGINYYVLAKLLWDPYRNVDEILDDYCTVGFGPAAGMIRQYFDEIERITNAIAEERQQPSTNTVVRYYTDDTLAKLDQILCRAESTVGYDTLIKERIAFLRKGLEYAPICRDYLVAENEATDGDKWQRRRYFEESVRRATWFQDLGPSWVIHAPWLIYWDW